VRWTRLVTIKAAGLGLAVAAASVVLAATTGVLPSPLHSPDPAGSGISTMDSTRFGTTPGGTGRSTGAGTPAPSTSRTGTPSPDYPGLCHAYFAQVGEDQEEERNGRQQMRSKPPAPTDKKTKSPTTGETALEAIPAATRPPGPRLDNPAFAALVAAAGSLDQIPSFCEALESASRDPQPPTDRVPPQTGPPTSHPGR
jgi:hypothetical protein